MKSIKTRFAPSPTGILHIGGLRTALFSYLFAKHNNGDFILRIEDTDRTRLVEGALEDIIDSLKWVGISWNEGPDTGGPYGPYLQSERKELYNYHAFSLIKKGHAYKCYCTAERLQALREDQKKLDIQQGYDMHCRSLSSREIKRHDEKGDPFVIRLKTPLTGETTFKDEIRGTIKTSNSIIDDFVIIKSDGFPTYHLANVIDDHLMKITHVIRGDEWIPSTPKHIILYNAFGWKPPVFAHVPVILAHGGGKLSKRHGSTMVREFRLKGYLSDAFLNFIVLLGWSMDDKTEFFEMDELIKNFDLKRVNKAPAVFSYEKLDWFNGMYIRKKSVHELYMLIFPYLIEANLITKDTSDQYKNYILEILPLIQERLKYLSEIKDRIWFFFDQHFEIKERDALIPKRLKKEDVINILNKALARLKDLKSFNEDEIEKSLRDLVTELELKTGQLFMIIRVAVTGTKVSPGLFETMRVLGKERVLKRLQYAREILKS